MPPFDIDTALLPVLPTDNTPEVVSGTPSYMLIGPATANDPNPVTITSGAAAATGAVALPVVALTTALPSGAKLDFGGVIVTLTALSAIGDTSLDVVALTAPIPAASTASYSVFARAPLSEEFMLNLTDDTEKIKIHGRITPISNKNGIDADADIKTIAGITDPVVEDLISAGMTLSGAKRTVIFVYADGFAVGCRMLIGTGKPDNKTGAAQRYDFKLMLSSNLYWTNLRKTPLGWNLVK